jgi:hypothetical protein
VRIADDATAPYWNPAGMVYLPYKEAFLQHAEQFGNLVNHDFGGVVFPLHASDSHRSAFGVSLTRVAVDDIPITPRPGGLKPGDWLDYGTDNDPTTPGNGQGNGQWDPGERLLDHVGRSLHGEQRRHGARDLVRPAARRGTSHGAAPSSSSVRACPTRSWDSM